ncbi:MAG: capsule assembly Wzi family protein [Gammaproteobacteria bacterium]|nr:capsule assembly Wzi family protein [Gammaproteobacteria bacterium]
MWKKTLLHTMVAAVCLMLITVAHAGPFVPPGDSALRHDIQLLADAGLLTVPVTTWPLSWGDVAGDLDGNDATIQLSRAAEAALARVRERLVDESETGRFRGQLRLAGDLNPKRVRSFQATPREEGEAGAALEWTGLRFAFRLDVTAAANPDDGKEARLDGSYAGVVLGNWMLTAGLQDQWWGPGQDGSLILSNNARPVPAVRIRRNQSLKFKSKWLSWVGPWTASLFAGQLEKDRFVPEAKLIGARVNFRPRPSLEIGLSRTAQWGGDGRPENLSSLIDLLLGKDNRGDDVTLEEEPGNQLAGVDFRWSSPFGLGPWALYGQYIGEDEAGGLPSRFIGQLGLEVWGQSAIFDGSFRMRLEYSDTASEFYSSSPRFNYTYEHFIYKDGYRYRGQALGHPIDNDGRLVSASALLVREAGASWMLAGRWGDLNRGGATETRHSVTAGPARYLDLELSHTRSLPIGLLEAGIGVESLESGQTGERKTDERLFVQWRSR